MKKWILHTAEVVLIGGIVLFGAAFLYAVFRVLSLRFGWTDSLHHSYFYYFYMIGAACGIVSCVLVLKSSETLKINIVLSGVSCLLGIYGIELVFSLLQEAHLSPERLVAKRRHRSQKSGRSFDDRTVQEVLEELRTKGLDAYPAVFASQILKDQPKPSPGLLPFSGISQTHTVYCNESGSYVIYQSDEHGFHNPLGSFDRNPAELMLIGDSFVQGHCVNTEDTLAGQLRSKGFHAVSLGMNGSGTLLEFAIFQEFAVPMYPRIVVWCYYEGNDLRDLEREQQNSWLLRYLHEGFSQQLFTRQTESDELLRQYIAQKMHAPQAPQNASAPIGPDWRLVLKLWHLRNRLGLAPTPAPPAPNAIFREILQHVKNQVDAWGGSLVFVYLPDWSRYVNSSLDHAAFLNRNQVLSIITELHIPVVDIHETLAAQPEPLSLFPFGLPGHYTEQGYQLAAQTIAQKLHEISKQTDANFASK